jgi:4-amino-4-deoxychorismate lyase
MDRWLINGVDGDVISVNDRGLSYGDGLFETVAVRRGQPRFIEHHFARLQQGCRRLSIELPDLTELASDIATLVEDHQHATVKLIVTRGTGKRGYSPASATLPQRMVGISKTMAAPTESYTEGIRARRCSTSVSRNPALAGLKTLNRLEQVLARSEWSDPAIAEGLMFDEAGFLICGTMSNVFLVINRTLVTPDLSFSGIQGVMRQQLFDCCSHAGIGIEEMAVTNEMLEHASEVLLTNSLIGLWPVRSIGKHQFTSREYAPRLMRLLAAKGVSECEAGAGE